MPLEDVYNSVLFYWSNYGGIIKEKSLDNEKSSLVLIRLDMTGREKTFYFVEFRKMIDDSNKTEVWVEIEFGKRKYFDYDYRYYIPSRPFNKWASIVGSSPDSIGRNKFYGTIILTSIIVILTIFFISSLMAIFS